MDSYTNTPILMFIIITTWFIVICYLYMGCTEIVATDFGWEQSAQGRRPSIAELIPDWPTLHPFRRDEVCR